MDLSQLDHVEKSSQETCSDSFLSPDSPDSNDIFGEPLVYPRVGDEYQIEIPCMLNKSKRLQLMANLAESEDIKDSSLSFLMGLPVPVMWIYDQSNFIRESTGATNKTHVIYTNGVVKSEKKVGMSHISSVEKGPKVKVDFHNQTSCLVPDQSSALWSDFEADCFLLGLYIFDKNLLQVARFMESKTVGQILSYYYGQFYGSTKYRRWSERWKKRNRKCVLGHKFFTGYRHHEFFARLAPRLSEESKTKFLEVSRAYVEGNTTLEDYVSSLKVLVGIRALVEAVGIGKGKGDLSTLILDGAKNSKLVSHRPEIPSGKACSSLTSAEIVKCLTGDFRLSKARSNDLFWEAVWPRLLARGWHSEQPQGDNYAGSKNCLVFLMPGIKKFSRRKLSKGDHYFDSVSDVLAKVAGEPELLDLEADETRPNSAKVENGWAIEVKSDDDHNLSDQERHCYLKPRVSSEITNPFKFTVVDTSLSNEDYPSKVRELRSLPPEARRSLSFRKTDRGSEVNVDTMRNGLPSSTTSAQSELVPTTDGASERLPGSHIMPLEKSIDANQPKDNRSATIKHQFSRRVNPGPTSCSSGQVSKRRKLVSCDEAELNFVLSLPARKNKGKNVAVSKAMMTNDTVPSKAIQSDDVKVTSTKTLVGGTSNFSSDASQGKEKLAQKPKIIDLNLPLVEPEIEARVKLEVESARIDEKVKLEVEVESDAKVKLKLGQSSVFQLPDRKKPEHSDAKDRLVSCVTAQTTNKGGDMLNQQPRRQSSRNRPLSTKALEALEIGLYSPVRHSRKRSPSTLQEQKAKRSGQLPNKNSMVPPVVDFEVKEAAVENYNGKMLETLGDKIAVEQAAMTRDLFFLPESSLTPKDSSKNMFT